jgi:hypothetical protein
MGSGGTGIAGGAGMSGGNFRRGQFAAPMGDLNQTANSPSVADSPSENYTYQCITSVGRCSFVAPAWLRANALRSGAGCACGGGRDEGRVE